MRGAEMLIASPCFCSYNTTVQQGHKDITDSNNERAQAADTAAATT
jgi:hypothetical protein